MPTALQMISRAMRQIQSLGSGETPTAQEQDDGLTALNAMLDTWNNESLSVYQILTESFTWAASQRTRTIGSGGDFDTTRPVAYEGAFQRLSDNVDYPVSIVTEQQYEEIPNKVNVTGNVARWIYPDMAFPLTTLYVYPVPTEALSIHLRTWKQLQSFATATTSLALPPGYENAIVWNLALQLAPEYSKEPTLETRRQANNAKRAIKQRNIRVPRATVEPAFMHQGPGRRFDYRTGM